MRYYHKNPRKITDKQFEDLKEWLAELGDLGGIVHDLNSDEIIGGNQRVRALGGLDTPPTITERFDPPTKQGTVSIGYYQIGDEQFKYRAVMWTKEQCEKANIIANKAGGDWDFDVLANEFELADLLEWGFDEGELGIIDKEDRYSRQIEAPTYTPSGEKPSIEELCDNSKALDLIEKINAADGITESEKEFLTLAAMRHVVFFFDKIADYYASSDPDIQRLMEDSALVIIDFHKAVEQGFVSLTRNIMEMVGDDYGE